MATQAAPLAGAPTTPAISEGKRYLLGPAADFLCFGGAALIILPLLLLVPVAQYKASILAATLTLALVVNNPHFAHSYQIFYRGFRLKAFTPSQGRTMQVRYLIAGIAVPIALVAFIAACVTRGDVRLLGLAGNAMGFFVGWHYVKQGYGLLMVDAALKRRFFTGPDKKLLLVNCYVVWIAAWISFNSAVAETRLFGIEYFSFAIPEPYPTIAMVAALVTTATVAWTLLGRWRSGQSLPVNGLLAYTMSLYPWLLFIQFNPLWLLVVPALHSLQYLAVVWHFQANYEKARLADPAYKAGSIARRLFGSHAAAHLGLFMIAGVVLGYLGFTLIPVLLQIAVPYDEATLGGVLFLFAAWIFINVHHYFMDNVMWRRENPETKRYLFG